MANTDKADLIMDNVKAAIAAITTGGGYNFTVGEVMRGLKNLNEVPEDKFPAAYIAGADEARENVTNSGFKSEMKITILGYVYHSDASDIEELQRSVNKFKQDVTKAIYVDHTRGGYCTYTEIDDIFTDKGTLTPYAVFEMIIKCDYRSTFAAG